MIQFKPEWTDLTVSASLLRLIVRFFEVKGRDVSRVAEVCSSTDQLLLESDGLSYKQFHLAFQELSNKLRDETEWWELAQFISAGRGALGLRHAANFEELSAIFELLTSMSQRAIGVVPLPQGQGIRLVISPHFPLGEIEARWKTLGAYIVINSLSHLTANGFEEMFVEVPSSSPLSSGTSDLPFKVVCGSEHAAGIADTEKLDLSADHDCYQKSFQAFERLSRGQVGIISYGEWARVVLLTGRYDSPSLIDVSRLMGVSPRTLSSRLKDEGTDFLSIVSQVRSSLENIASIPSLEALGGFKKTARA